MTPELMIVQDDDRAVYHRRRWERTERGEICIADSFEYPNRCDWRCSHDREGCIRRTRNNSVGRHHVEIFVRPMRYKASLPKFVPYPKTFTPTLARQPP